MKTTLLNEISHPKQFKQTVNPRSQFNTKLLLNCDIERIFKFVIKVKNNLYIVL